MADGPFGAVRIHYVLASGMPVPDATTSGLRHALAAGQRPPRPPPRSPHTHQDSAHQAAETEEDQPQLAVGLETHDGDPMKNETPTNEPARVLVVGRSPSVLVAAVDLLRSKGHLADATNQFEQVLDDYDVSDLDVLVFGGMVPPDTKQYLRDEITKRNAEVTFVQGLVGIPGVIAAQVDAVTSGDSSDAAEIGYNPDERSIRVTLADAVQVTVEALWMTSWRPPEPTSTSMRVFDGELAAGSHDIVLADEVPSEASFVAVTVGAQVRVLTVGPLPKAVTRMVPKSAADRRLPGVAAVTTDGDDT